MSGVSELQKIAEGREAEIFAWDDGAVLRLMRNPAGQRAVESQSEALKAAHEAGVKVPQPARRHHRRWPAWPDHGPSRRTGPAHAPR